MHHYNTLVTLTFFFNSLIHTFTQMKYCLIAGKQKRALTLYTIIGFKHIIHIIQNIHPKAEIIRTAKSAISEQTQ